MKVLYLTNFPSPYRVDFFNELGKKCDLTVLFEKNKGKKRNEKWVSGEFTNFNGIFLNKIKLPKIDYISPSVIKYLDKFRFDLIVIGGYSTPTGMLAINYCNLRGIKFILNTDGGVIRDDNFIKYIFKKYFISSAHWWLSTSDVTSKYLVHYGAKIENIYKYPFTSVNDYQIESKSMDEKNNMRRNLNLPEGKLAISVGNFIHRKGFDVLIKAWEKIDDDINLLIVGGGELKNQLLRCLDQKKIKNVKILDFVIPEKLNEYYLSADLFVLSTREDIWGLVINESMAKGLPVVTTEKCIAGLEMVTDDENGYIVETENSDQLAEAVLKILKNSELNKKMSENNILKSKKYTIQTMSTQHINIFNQILQ